MKERVQEMAIEDTEVRLADFDRDQPEDESYEHIFRILIDTSFLYCLSSFFCRSMSRWLLTPPAVATSDG